jgi:TetR/AcrR family transcriptional regulator, mexJK operon transcriptional repressor
MRAFRDPYLMPISKKNKTPQQLSAERRDVLLEAATRELLERGFRGCSIDHISRVSGVSKTTIYRQYPNKEALFEAVALQTAEGMADLAETPLDATAPESCLRALADRIYRSQREDRFRELFRLLIAETPHLPDLARRVRAQMMERLLTTLTAYFVELIDAGRMRHPDPLHAAATFTVLASGSFRLLLNAAGSDADERAKLDADITLFLRGVGLIA